MSKMEQHVTGSDAVLMSAVAGGVDVCFANPGTTELPLLEALDRCPQIRPVLALFEGVCTGAADGYARVSGRPALALLHLGPGLANGLANLHNARRACSPVVSIVGEHATWHLSANAPLSSDIAGLAAPMSKFTRTSISAHAAAQDMAQTVARAVERPAGPSTLILPADVQWGHAPNRTSALPRFHQPGPDAPTIHRVARALRSSKPSALILGHTAMRARGLRAAQQVALVTGCQVLSPTFPSIQDRGGARLSPRRIPYPIDAARELFASLDLVVLAGTDEPVAFFGYPNGSSKLLSGAAEVISLCDPDVDPTDALEALADALSDRSLPPGAAARPDRQRPSGPLTGASMCQALVAVQPEGAIVVDESVTAGFSYYELSDGAPAFTYMTLVGGSIGHGLPCAVGAAAAQPASRVICVVGDGSALYTIQALWTMARERQDVTVVICKNRAYAILRWEMQRLGTRPGAASRALTGLDDPDIDFVELAAGFGVDGRSVSTAEQFIEALQCSLKIRGPMLIEALLSIG